MQVEFGISEAGSSPPIADRPEVRQASHALRRFLAGFGIEIDVTMESLIGDWCHRALQVRREHPESDLATIAVAEAESDLNHWFQSVLGAELIGDQPPVRVGRAAYLLSGAGHRWPEHFLSGDALPDEILAALRNAVPPSTPPTEPATMPEQALEPWTLRSLVGALPRVLLGRAAAAAP